MRDIDCGTRIIVRCNDEMEQSNKKMSTIDNLRRSREMSSSMGEINYLRKVDQGEVDFNKILSKTNKKEKII